LSIGWIDVPLRQALGTSWCHSKIEGDTQVQVQQF
jgi:hypothetical protein